MSDFVTDTHALYWHLTNSPALSETARRHFTEADDAAGHILVPGIALVEYVYLVERGRLAPEPFEEILRRIDAPASNYAIAPLDQGTIGALGRIPRPAIPDMPDRIIAATALQLGLPLITRDEAIHRSGVVPVVW